MITFHTDEEAFAYVEARLRARDIKSVLLESITPMGDVQVSTTELYVLSTNATTKFVSGETLYAAYRAMPARRPKNYAELSPEEQWAVDKRLGCLDDEPKETP